MPKISIVLPTYNGERYIQESINSIINQTFTDWELIIVNDCSTDDTSLILNTYAVQDERIKVINNDKNQKLPQSLNIGFQNASGEYLSWTSDDNYYLPDAIEKMVAYLDTYKDIYMVCANMYFIDLNGTYQGVFQEYDETLMYFQNYVGACFAYRKEVLEKIGGYDSDMFLVEDYDYWLRILLNFKKIGYIQEPLYAYRRHSNSLTESRNEDVWKQLFILRRKYLKQMLEKLDKNSICRMYCEFLEKKEDVSDVYPLFLEAVPELSLDKDFDFSKKAIIYGAGEYGDKVYEAIKDQTVYFADKDLEKVGKEKNKIPIISLDQMLKLQSQSQYQIVIARGSSSIYEMLKFLSDNGVGTCTLCYKFGV